jgi:hypothetical protein
MLDTGHLGAAPDDMEEDTEAKARMARARKARAELEQELKACRREIAQARERLAEASERKAAGIIGCRQPAYRSPRASLQGRAQSRSELMSIGNARFCFARIIVHPGKAHQVDAKSHG